MPCGRRRTASDQEKQTSPEPSGAFGRESDPGGPSVRLEATPPGQGAGAVGLCLHFQVALLGYPLRLPPKAVSGSGSPGMSGGCDEGGRAGVDGTAGAGLIGRAPSGTEWPRPTVSWHTDSMSSAWRQAHDVPLPVPAVPSAREEMEPFAQGRGGPSHQHCGAAGPPRGFPGLGALVQPLA